MNKKDLIIAILATFCLTATLFIILPIRGQEGEYDPWLDLNDDGSINILESILVGNHFLTNGDPAKNVNVTNWPSWWPSGNVYVTNFPPLQNVNVSNFPSQQNVNVNNFPSQQNVNVTNFPSQQNVNVTNFPSKENVTVTNFPSQQNVNVTNWPYTQSQLYSKEIYILANYSLVIAPNSTVNLNLGTFWTIGYSRMSICASVANTSTVAAYSLVRIDLSANETYSSGTATPGIFGVNPLIQWNSISHEDFGKSWPSDAMYTMKAPAYSFELRATYEVHYPLQPSATCLLSIELYLRNE